ncbi:hypothetical protein OG689_38475 [Kitasatospora sp. NBC_00240]|uniref:hypothetical protein n=1 Tax=Kitasatospora sp. NBC_00240 TaxID=2903567 RepID=UPI00224FC3D3|nr:hypothetical protein [Kitasatospora sp. NBC_00240]MCX5215082.1 hypothetical protein [Kitasatospora sp. NBC_00240]
MTGVDVVLAALAAGVTGGITEAASGAVRDAYNTLRDAVGRRLAVRGEQSVRLLESYQAEPGVWRVALAGELNAAGAEHDRELLAAARALLDAQSAPTPEYHVDASHARGVQTGDHNTQHNTFN